LPSIIFSSQKNNSHEKETPTFAQSEPWKILIVDDDEDIHCITNLIISKINFENRPIAIFKALDSNEAYQVLQQEPDIALILLDVVMEHEHAGLELVHRIRRELKNTLTRIVLRTGQAGQIPVRDLIVSYDINDYKDKTELTSEKLFICVISALRNYRDLCEVDTSRKSLRAMIESSPYLMGAPTISRFTSEALHQLQEILLLKVEELEALWVYGNASLCQYNIVATLGGGQRWKGQRSSAEFPPMINRFFHRAKKEGKAFAEGKVIVAYFPNPEGQDQFLYFRTERELNPIEKELAWAFISHAGVFCQNLAYRSDLQKQHSELLHILSGAMEYRSPETGYHVQRIASYADIIARELRMDDFNRECLRKAAPLHDVGKIGIPDHILHKPEKYNEEEFEIMKNHCAFGRDILRSGKHPILQSASIIAYQHHERWDGKGYPQGLSRESIHIFARIIAIVDVFDALSMARCYKPAWNLEKIITYLKNERNRHFEGRLVDIFLAQMDEVKAIQNNMKDEITLT
jgi:response regulator RpfG family c-di-GMP phosphodiesterase